MADKPRRYKSGTQYLIEFIVSCAAGALAWVWLYGQAIPQDQQIWFTIVVVFGWMSLFIVAVYKFFTFIVGPVLFVILGIAALVAMCFIGGMISDSLRRKSRRW